ncbi:MAG TPA: hypothetical protein VF993_10845, partial [Myxococcales bacterium]
DVPEPNLINIKEMKFGDEWDLGETEWGKWTLTTEFAVEGEYIPALGFSQQNEEKKKKTLEGKKEDEEADKKKVKTEKAGGKPAEDKSALEKLTELKENIAWRWKIIPPPDGIHFDFGASVNYKWESEGKELSFSPVKFSVKFPSGFETDLEFKFSAFKVSKKEEPKEGEPKYEAAIGSASATLDVKLTGDLLQTVTTCGKLNGTFSFHAEGEFKLDWEKILGSWGKFFIDTVCEGAEDAAAEAIGSLGAKWAVFKLSAVEMGMIQAYIELVKGYVGTIHTLGDFNKADLHAHELAGEFRRGFHEGMVTGTEMTSDESIFDGDLTNQKKGAYESGTKSGKETLEKLVAHYKEEKGPALQEAFEHANPGKTLSDEQVDTWVKKTLRRPEILDQIIGRAGEMFEQRGKELWCSHYIDKHWDDSPALCDALFTGWFCPVQSMPTDDSGHIADSDGHVHGQGFIPKSSWESAETRVEALAGKYLSLRPVGPWRKGRYFIDGKDSEELETC